MAKKYLSKIKKDGNDVYIKDTEARTTLNGLPEVYHPKSNVMTAEDGEDMFNEIFNLN